MKIINCGIVTYVISGNHIATIVYNYNNGKPAATIYLDGQHSGIIEAENGMTMKYAMRVATFHVKADAYWDEIGRYDVSAEDLTEWQAASCGCDYYTYKRG